MKTNKNPKISVIIPVYNGERYIKEAIDSVLNQTYENYEIIVINDGSTDNTIKILKNYVNKIRWKNQENKGVVSAKNSGIKIAKGEYFAYLDADDVFLPDKLELQIKKLNENPKLGLVFCEYYYMDKNGKIIKLIKPTKKIKLIQDNFIPTSGVICKKSCLEKIGIFEYDVGSDYDWDLWLRISEQFPISYVNKPLLKYRIHSSNISRTRVKNIVDYELEMKIKLLEKAYLRRNKPFWLKMKILRAKLERQIYKLPIISDKKVLPLLKKLYDLVNKIEKKLLKI